MEYIDTSSVELFLEPYLPNRGSGVFVTATWAQSLDGRIAAAPGERTVLSGLYSKKMTHFLRSRHDAILVGRRTVSADNPKLNCRYSRDCLSPRPVILDSALQWDLSDPHSWHVLENASTGWKAPWVIADRDISEPKRAVIESFGGEVIRVKSTRDWAEICNALGARGIRSLMVEGGAAVLDSCLTSGVASAVIITLAPVFLGKKGVDIAPTVPQRLQHVNWWTSPDVPDGVVAARAEEEAIGVRSSEKHESVHALN